MLFRHWNSSESFVRRLEPQHSRGVGGVSRVIARMPLAVVDHDFLEIEWRDAFQAGDVDPELVGIRATLVVRVDAAFRAKVMLGDVGVEPVRLEFVFTLRDAETVVGRCYRDRAAHPADGTGATPRGAKSKRQFGGELHGPAMA